MQLAERATVIASTYPRSEVMRRGSDVLYRIGQSDADELVVGEDVAWLLAAAIVRNKVNGEHSGPKIHTVVLDDGVKLSDGIG